LFSTSAALGLAVRLNGLTTREALVAGTANAARALGLDDAGRIEPDAYADFAVLKSADWRDLLYTMAINPIHEVWSRGSRIAAFAESENATAQRERQDG
jgi:imidazolonepropionase